MIQDTNPLHTIEVHCSNSYLSNLPERLPENTVKLNVSNNNVSETFFFYYYLVRKINKTFQIK